jgi:uncharacterized protein
MKITPGLIVSAIIIVFLSGVLILRNVFPETKDIAQVEIAGKTFSVEVADEEEEREKGLSNRKTLGENEGMLFVFEYPTIPVFWMKDMKFPIDIVWISEGKVIGWVSNVLPEPGIRDEDLAVYSPPQLVDMILEIPSGTVSGQNIVEGDAVSVKI